MKTDLGTEFYNAFFRYLYEMVQKGKLTFEDIGTSEEEFGRVRTRRASTTPCQWFRSLSLGTELLDSFLAHLRKELQENGVTLQDIGVREEQLEQLRK